MVSPVSNDQECKYDIEISNNYYCQVGVTSTNDKGLGLFSKSHINSNQLILSNIAKELTTEINFKNIDAGLLQYLFFLPFDVENDHYAMVCGEMVFINHNDQPNSKVAWRYNSSGLLFADLFSTSDIKPDEEITIEYRDIEYYRSKGLI